MPHGFDSFDESAPWSAPIQEETSQSELVVRVHAVAFYLALLKAGMFDEAGEFAEWYLEAFDHDLET